MPDPADNSAERAAGMHIAASDTLAARSAFFAVAHHIAPSPLPRTPPQIAELRELLASSGISQGAAAEIMGVATPTVSMALSGDTTISAERVALLRAHLSIT